MKYLEQGGGDGYYTISNDFEQCWGEWKNKYIMNVAY